MILDLMRLGERDFERAVCVLHASKMGRMSTEYLAARCEEDDDLDAIGQAARGELDRRARMEAES